MTKQQDHQQQQGQGQGERGRGEQQQKKNQTGRSGGGRCRGGGGRGRGGRSPGGGRSKGSGGGGNNRKGGKASGKSLSHHLSWALRHAAIDILNLTMTPDGYVPVQEILDCKHPKFNGVTLDEIKKVVMDNDKQRFSMKELPYENYYKTNESDDADTTGATDATKFILCIRANQGHSIKNLIDPNLLLTPIEKDELKSIPVIVHGTYKKPYEIISHEGLSKMNRMHIHFAVGLPSQDGVISGMRKTCQIYIFLDGKKCAQDNIKFYKSDNNVILSAGVDESGILPTKYFSHVVDGTTGNVIFDQRQQSPE